MRSHSQILHQIRKDLVGNRLLLLILSLAFGVVVGMEFLASMPLLPTFAALLGLYLIWVVFVAQVVQADPIRGRRARWRTLPISGWALFWSKCIVTVVTWVALLIATRMPWLAGIEGAWTDLAIPALLALPGLILVVALALMTPNFKVFATLGIVAVVGISLMRSAGGPAQGESGEFEPLEVAEPATTPLAPEHQLRIDHYRIGVSAVTTQMSSAEVSLRAAPSPEPIGYHLISPEVERYLPSGDTVRGSHTDQAWSIQSHSHVLGDSVRWLGPAGPPSDTLLIRIPIDAPAAAPGGRTILDAESMPEPGSNGRFRARVEALRSVPLVTISSQDSEVRHPRRRWQMLGASVGSDGPEVRVRLIEAPGTFLRGIRHPFSTGLARRDAVAWVLHSPAHGEAVLLVGRIQEQRGDARTGSIRTLVLTPLQNDSGWRFGVDHRFDPPPPLPIDRAWLDDAELHVLQWESLGVQELTLRF